MKLTLLFTSIFLLAGGGLRASVVINSSPALQTVSVGSIAKVQVDISGLGQNTAPSLGAYDLNIAFDPTILSFLGLTFGDPLLGDQLDLSGIGTVNDYAPSPGLLEFYEVSLDSAAVLDSLQADHFVLATLQFHTLSAGSSFITPSLNALSDSQGMALTAGTQNGRVDVVVTPEPGAFSMVLFAGLAGLVGRRSMRQIRPAMATKLV